MNKDGNTIGSFELFSLLYLSRIMAFFTYSLSFREDINTGDRTIMSVFLLLFTVLLSLPSLLYAGKNNRTGIIKQAQCVSTTFGKMTAVIYALFFLWYNIVTAARFEVFASTVMFSQSEIGVFIAIFIFSAVYCAIKGIEAIGRAGLLFLFLIVGSLLFIIITIIRKFDPLNITPALYDGIVPVAMNGFTSAVRTVEPLSLMIIAPHVSGNIRRGWLRWLLLIFLTIIVTFTLIGGVTGNYGDIQLFQMFTLTALSGFSIFERLDALQTGLWTLCGLAKIAYFIYVTVLCIEQGFSIKVKKALYVVSGIIIFIASSLMSDDAKVFANIVSSPIISIVMLFVALVLPLAVYIPYTIQIKRIKAGKEHSLCEKSE